MRIIKLSFIFFILTFVFLNLVIWFISPIFPDEVAFRFTSARFYEDGIIAKKLFFICNDNSRVIPVIFYIPAFLLSFIDLNTSYIGARTLPSLILLFLFTFTFLNPSNRPLFLKFPILVIIIGVAGSGLVIARYEYWQLFLIFFCVLALFIRNTISLNLKFFICIFLILLLIIALYTHLQSLLFLPLCFLSLYFLFDRKNIYFIILLFCSFLYLTYISIAFHSFDCSEYPGIQKSFKSMVINTSNLTIPGFFIRLVDHFNVYLNAFIYKDSYQVFYLPGIKNIGVELVVVNYFIKLILSFNIILFLILVYKSLKNICIIFLGSLKVSESKVSFLTVFIGLPAIFIFIYDNNQNFYRLFFINTLLCIVIYLNINIYYLNFRGVTLKVYSFICLFIFIITTALNYNIFFPQLISGYEGPSISVFEDRSAISSRIDKVTSDANIDLSQGYLIVDDLTYPFLKKFPNLFPITYLDFSSTLVGMSSSDVIAKIGARGVITRCSYMISWKLSPQYKSDNICAINLSTY
jgi:hypothetical protein